MIDVRKVIFMILTAILTLAGTCVIGAEPGMAAAIGVTDNGSSIVVNTKAGLI